MIFKKLIEIYFKYKMFISKMNKENKVSDLEKIIHKHLLLILAFFSTLFYFKVITYEFLIQKHWWIIVYILHSILIFFNIIRPMVNIYNTYYIIQKEDFDYIDIFIVYYIILNLSRIFGAITCCSIFLFTTDKFLNITLEIDICLEEY